MRRADNRCTLDPALTALALRGLSKPASYPFVEGHLWRRRAAGLFAALRTLHGRRTQPKPKREAQVSS
jgi:hypothetical protein